MELKLLDAEGQAPLAFVEPETDGEIVLTLHVPVPPGEAAAAPPTPLLHWRYASVPRGPERPLAIDPADVQTLTADGRPTAFRLRYRIPTAALQGRRGAAFRTRSLGFRLPPAAPGGPARGRADLPVLARRQNPFARAALLLALLPLLPLLYLYVFLRSPLGFDVLQSVWSAVPTVIVSLIARQLNRIRLPNWGLWNRLRWSAALTLTLTATVLIGPRLALVRVHNELAAPVELGERPASLAIPGPGGHTHWAFEAAFAPAALTRWLREGGSRYCLADPRLALGPTERCAGSAPAENWVVRLLGIRQLRLGCRTHATVPMALLAGACPGERQGSDCLIPVAGGDACAPLAGAAVTLALPRLEEPPVGACPDATRSVAATIEVALGAARRFDRAALADSGPAGRVTLCVPPLPGFALRWRVSDDEATPWRDVYVPLDAEPRAVALPAPPHNRPLLVTLDTRGATLAHLLCPPAPPGSTLLVAEAFRGGPGRFDFDRHGATFRWLPPAGGTGLTSPLALSCRLADAAGGAPAAASIEPAVLTLPEPPAGPVPPLRFPAGRMPARLEVRGPGVAPGTLGCDDANGPVVVRPQPLPAAHTQVFVPAPDAAPARPSPGPRAAGDGAPSWRTSWQSATPSAQAWLCLPESGGNLVSPAQLDDGPAELRCDDTACTLMPRARPRCYRAPDGALVDTPAAGWTCQPAGPAAECPGGQLLACTAPLCYRSPAGRPVAAPAAGWSCHPERPAAECPDGQFRTCEAPACYRDPAGRPVRAPRASWICRPTRRQPGCPGDWLRTCDER